METKVTTSSKPKLSPTEEKFYELFKELFAKCKGKKSFALTTLMQDYDFNPARMSKFLKEQGIIRSEGKGKGTKYFWVVNTPPNISMAHDAMRAYLRKYPANKPTGPNPKFLVEDTKEVDSETQMNLRRQAEIRAAAMKDRNLANALPPKNNPGMALFKEKLVRDGLRMGTLEGDVHSLDKKNRNLEARITKSESEIERLRANMWTLVVIVVLLAVAVVALSLMKAFSL
ncbi:hypothetical protein PP178_04035 [Zeaxanthinibacter sp. PT1]|uniref:hypothetical protein n=1 Tax=Zeaxanthinibacter TaxID=561554 RepID=UPI00234AD039|nr:hypothetical protein [Zeaxanthinibacter sp. PT1]MDC6350710.1 hypothetical protein [Zeaxanthinibacter sp. PT1]